MNFKNISFDELIGKLLFASTYLLLLPLLVQGINQSLFSHDELFTIYISSLSFKDMIYATAVDVHPPLYYILLKTFMLSFHHLFSFDIILAKIFSVIPVILLTGFSLTKIKKDFGWLASGIFCFSIVTMPKILYYSVQIRMYSWVMFFVTISFYYSYKIIKQSNNKNWIIFTISGLSAAYTHYYGTIAFGFLFILLLGYNISFKKYFFKIGLYYLVITLCFYCPYMYIFFSSSKYFHDSQWSVPCFKTILNVIGFTLSPITNVLNHDDLNNYGIILFISIIILFLIMFLRRISINNYPHSIIEYGLFLSLAVLFFGLIFSVLIKPMFEARYLLVVLPVFWLSFSICLSKSYSKKIIFVPIFIILLLSGIVNSIYFIDCKNYEKNTDQQFKDSIHNLTKNDTIIYLGPEFMIAKFKLSFNLDNDFILWKNKTNISSIKKHQVYVFDCGFKNFSRIDDFNKSMIKNGLRLDELGKINQCYLAYPRYVYVLANA